MSDHALAHDGAGTSDDKALETLHALFSGAKRLLQEKRGDQALPALREILRLRPDLPDALNLTSVAFGQMGMIEEAVSYSRQAIGLKPDDAGFRLNLANRLNDQGQIEEAIDAYKAALDLAPGNIAALKSYMRCMVRQRRWPEAREIVDRLHDHIQNDPQALVECAEVSVSAEDRRHALDLYQQALASDPDNIDWLLQIARLATMLQQLELAKTTGERVLELTEHPEMRSMLASIMHRLGDFKNMVKHLDAIPEGSDQAANAANLKGMLLVSQSKIREGLDAMGQTEKLAPDAFALQATRVMYLNYDPDLSRSALHQAHQAFGRSFANAVPLLDQHQVALPHDPDRRLRIGFVSPDFRSHSVAYFTRPFFDAFDRDRFDVVCYAHLSQEDQVSADLKTLVTDWRNIFDWSDQRLAEQIRKDRIDILIDLAGLTRDTRLLAFTARPSPIQMTYIGYPNTTGLPQVDYRITDWIADPEGVDDDYGETLIRMPGCFLCYALPSHAPPLEPGPSEHRDVITFGSFNNFAKVNPDVLRLWADVLHAVPKSQLLCKSTSSGDPTAQSVVRDQLVQHGINPERVRFSNYRKTPQSHLAVYNDVDIALDTFPYSGTTTTCEALWMGVPVVTLRGERHASRVGASLLTAVGFEAGIAESREDYVLTARLLAENPGILKTARRTLRDTVHRSPLCDGQAHTRTLEEAFRAVWQIWCEEGPRASEAERLNPGRTT